MKNKNNKRIQNDSLIEESTLSGSITPNSDALWSIGSANKRIKNLFAQTISVASAITTFVALSLTGTTNQITMGTGTKTTLNSVQPTQNQTITLGDSGQANSKIILQDCGSQQLVNSELKVASNVTFTPNSTFLQNGQLQIKPDGNSKSMLKILDFGPGASALELNVNNTTSIAAPVASAQYFTDDIPGDSVFCSSANSGIYPNAAIRLGFSGNVATALSITRSLITAASPITLSNTTNINGQLTITPPNASGATGIGSVAITGTGSISFSLRNFLLGYCNTAATFLSDSAVSDLVIRNGVSNASLRIGFGAGSTSSVVVNSSALTSNVPVVAPSVSISGDNNVFTFSNNAVNSSKTQRFLTYDFTGSNQWAFMIPYSQFAGSNRLLVGGGSVVANAATSVEVYAAPNTTTLTGTKIVGITTSGLNVASGNLSVNGTSNQLQLGNGTISVVAPGSRTYTLPDSYQSCNLLTNSIVSLTNTSSRPAIAANSQTQPWEIRAFSATALSNDDAFLRIRAGGSSFAASSSWIDLSGSSTVPDMNRNIVFGAAGNEVARIDATGLTVKSGYTVTTPSVTLPTTSGTLTSTGAISTTISYRYQITGNCATLTFFSTGGTTTSSGSINGTLPAALIPSSVALLGTTGVFFSYTAVIGGITTPAIAKIGVDGTISFFANTSAGLFSSSASVSINAQTVTYIIY